jgi:hypothetical protein
MEANMANYYYGINKGQQLSQAVVNTSTNSTDVELFVNGTNITSKEDIVIALQHLTDKVVQSNWTPL